MLTPILFPVLAAASAVVSGNVCGAASSAEAKGAAPDAVITEGGRIVGGLVADAAATTLYEVTKQGK